AKVVSRTRKRDVHERRTMRRPFAQRAAMTPAEEQFYLEVTGRVRAHCARLDIAEGFMLTIPQRQMCSSMAAAWRAWSSRRGGLSGLERPRGGRRARRAGLRGFRTGSFGQAARNAAVGRARTSRPGPRQLRVPASRRFEVQSPEGTALRILAALP